MWTPCIWLLRHDEKKSHTRRRVFALLVSVMMPPVVSFGVLQGVWHVLLVAA